MIDKRFVKMYYDLLSAGGFVGKDGELVNLTITEKAIYCLMSSRFEFFVNEKKGTYYDTQESIGAALNIDRRTVLQKLKVFMKHGIIVGVKKKRSNFMNWNYTAVREMKLWWKVDEKVVYRDPHPNSSEITDKSTDKPVNVPMIDDDSDLPF